MATVKNGEVIKKEPTDDPVIVADVSSSSNIASVCAEGRVLAPFDKNGKNVVYFSHIGGVRDGRHTTSHGGASGEV